MNTLIKIEMTHLLPKSKWANPDDFPNLYVFPKMHKCKKYLGIEFPITPTCSTASRFFLIKNPSKSKYRSAVSNSGPLDLPSTVPIITVTFISEWRRRLLHESDLQLVITLGCWALPVCLCLGTSSTVPLWEDPFELPPLGGIMRFKPPIVKWVESQCNNLRQYFIDSVDSSVAGAPTSDMT
eukprot:Gb_39790 [translate_table: standard]